MRRLLFGLVLRRVLATELELVIAGATHTLRFDQDSDLTKIAEEFVLTKDLSGGEGCSSRECVTAMVASAMRQRLGQPGQQVNRVSVAGAIYREQGAVEVERQLQEAKGTLSGRKTRTVRAPCVPPYCQIDCAISDANVEARIASEFIEKTPELQKLYTEWPEPRRCPGGEIYPLFIGIPLEDVVSCVPRKYRGFQGGVHEHHTPYKFGPAEEAEYKRAYREAYFGVTKKKAGWDCLRHYEIIASGAVPVFDDIQTCPEKTLAFWPKNLLDAIAGNYFPGVDVAQHTVDAAHLDADGTYPSVAAGLLTFARARLTTVALADYVLTTTGHANATKVLLLSSHPDPDYQRDMLIHGLRTRLGPGLVDFIRPPHLYAPAAGSDPPPHDVADHNRLYGYGFTYAHRLRDDVVPIDRSNIELQIRNHTFDLIIFASVHRGMPFWPAVLDSYAPRDRIFIDGEDEHGWCPWSSALRQEGFFFMRELPNGCPPVLSQDFNVSQYRHFHGPFHLSSSLA